jgi:hypothetical protein
MTKNIFQIIFLSITIIIPFSSVGWSWNDDVTHVTLSEKAIEASIISDLNENHLVMVGLISHFKNSILLWPNQVCNNKGKTACTASNWITYGAEKKTNIKIPQGRIFLVDSIIIFTNP